MTTPRFARSLATVAVSLLALVLAPGSVAQAGSCPVCTSSSECTSFDDGGVAFCVLHAGDVGCGSARMICCPGQGCAIEAGRPSCEGTTCTVVENLVDGGPAATDAGPSGTDSGPSGTDSGPSTGDSGPSTADSGGPMDAGPSTPPVTTASCGCHAVSRAGAGPALGVTGLLAWGLVARRRARGRRSA